MAMIQVHPRFAVADLHSLKPTEKECLYRTTAFAALLEQREEVCPPPASTERSPLKEQAAYTPTIGIKGEMNRRFLNDLLLSEEGKADIRYTGLFDRLILPEPVSSTNPPRHQLDDGATSSPGGIHSLIEGAAHRYGVDPALVRSVIKVESNFNPDSTSPKGAMGLMQLMPDTAKELGLANPYDPKENIQAGTLYLRRLLDRYQGDIPSALAAYNWGMGNLERRTGKLPAETTHYVERVLTLYHSEQKV